MITLSILIVLALICALVGVLMGLFSLIGLLASLLVDVYKRQVGEECSLFLRRQLHHQRLQQQLGRNIPIVCRQLLEKLRCV